MKKIVIIFLIILSLGSLGEKAFGQESWFYLHADSLASEIPELEQEIDITVSNVDLQEFFRAIANSSELNLSVEPELDIAVTNNFKGVTVKDMLVFLEMNYPIRVEVVGNIVSVRKKEQVPTVDTNLGGVKYDSIRNSISLDYYQKPLLQVAREITKLSGKNIILAPTIEVRMVSGYVEDMPFEAAIEQFAFSNDLKLRTTQSGFYVLEPNQQERAQQDARTNRTTRTNSRQNSNSQGDDEYTLELNRTSANTINIKAINAPLEEVLQKVSTDLNMTYFFSSEIQGSTSIIAQDINFETFLKDVLNGTPYLFKKDKEVYIIGENSNSLLKEYTVFQFQNRTIDNVIDAIPEDLKEELIVKEFPDLNSLMISGDFQRVDRLTNLLTSIDKTVPVILIEVFIVNISRNYTISTGINAGIGEFPIETQGAVFPGVDLQLGSDGINKILQDFDGFGVLNLGNITPNFYLTLKALEEQGVLDVSSTPKLSTLNGYEATMKIGETEYYLEETSNFIGTQNPSLSTSKVYKDIKAELSITIRPIVSGDDQITLDVSVEQSDFTERISNEAPPGSVNRTFESIIRVKNQETIILGGLEEKRVQDSSTGTPFLSRIPVIKWLFSSRHKQNQNTKLNIFIKPTIIG